MKKEVDEVYLCFQKIMLNHSKNKKFSTQKALYWISRFGIPKEKRYEVLKIMRDKKLLNIINRDNIIIINSKKSKMIDKKVYDIIWNIVLGDKS